MFKPTHYREGLRADRERAGVVYFWLGGDAMKRVGIENPGRRSFLRAAPAAAAAGLALTDARLFGLQAETPSGWPGPAAKFQVFTAAAMAQDMAAVEDKPGNLTLVEDKGVPFSIVMTCEKRKSAPVFEWHQDRDHIFQILDGWTEYEVGGTPKGGKYIGPGEWRGPDVEGATKLTLHKGDRLVIPRGTPHRRSTPESVTFTLISPEGVEKA